MPERRPALGDTVRTSTGDEGRVTGTMTTRASPGWGVQRSVCVQTTHGPVWVPMTSVTVIRRADPV